MSETYVVRRGPILRVRINGVLDTLCLSAETSFGFSLRVAQATAVFPRVPSASEWDWVEIEMGPDLPGAAVRFAGYVVQIRYDLYPNAVALVCRGTLVRAERMQGEESDADPDGIDLTNGGLGQTDEAMVTQVLERCGVPELSIDGTGFTLGTVAIDQFFWTANQPGLAMIEDIEEATLGYRTFNAPAGACVRRKIAGSPAGTAAVTFSEGVDIERGDQESTVLETYNEVQVTGFDDGTGLGPVMKTLSQGSPFLPPGISMVRTAFSSAKIEQENAADVGDGLSCEEVAQWLLGEYNRKLSRVTFTTPRADRLFPGMTIQVDAPNRLGVSRNYWLQEVKTDVSEEGVFSQHLTCIGGVQSNAPVDDDEVIKPLADFTLLVEVERVVIAGVETTLYTVYCQDVSVGFSGTISSRAWSATGGNPTSGSDATFVTVYTSLTGETIALTVTDANGRSDTRTKTIGEAAPAANQVVRRLFAAAGSNFEVFDGATWRVDAPSAGSVAVVAHGPLAAAGDLLLVTEDDLATGATESQPFGAGVNVTAIWTELDVDPNQVLLGGANGQIAYSTNGGSSFTVKAGPTATAIVRVVISRFTPGQFHVLTGDGYYVSDNYGDGWRTIRLAVSGQIFQDLALSHTRNVIASVVAGSGAALETAEDGTVFTFPVAVTDVYAVTAHIGEDRFYCYDSAGQTFYTSAAGGTEMAQGASLPTPAQAQLRGLWRDGAIVDLLYVANGTGGLHKSLDGLRSSGGYYALRSPGVGNSAAGADYAMVGVDGNLQTPVVASDMKGYVLWDGARVMRTWNIQDASPTWELVDSGITGDIYDGQYVEVDADTVGMWLMTSDGIWWCEDIMVATPSWTNVLSLATVQAAEVQISGNESVFAAMYAYPGEPGFLIVATNPADANAAGDTQTYGHAYSWHTHDYGQTWTTVDMSGFSNNGSAYAWCPRYAVAIYASQPTIWMFRRTSTTGGSSAVFRSDDGGHTWSKGFTVASTDPEIGLLAPYPNLNGPSYAMHRNTFYVSTDGWATATARTAPTGMDRPASRLRPNSNSDEPDHVLCYWMTNIGDARLFESDDQGANWTEIFDTTRSSTQVQTPNGWPADTNVWVDILVTGSTNVAAEVVRYTDDKFQTTEDKRGNLQSLITDWTGSADFYAGPSGFALPRVGANA